VRVGDFEDGVLSMVCCSSGRTADDFYSVRFTRTPGWAVFLAIVAFPWGLIAVPFSRLAVSGFLPFTDESQARMREARRVSLQRLALLGGLTVFGTWVIWLVDRDIALIVLVIGLVGCGVLGLMAGRPRGSIGGRPESNGRWVVLTDVAPEFADAYASKLAVERADRRAASGRPADIDR
jgi:hypothetical protein